MFDLDINPLRSKLLSIVDANSSNKKVIITLPNADGGMEDFEVFEASNFEPELQVQFPEIRAFSGKGITDKYATLKLSLDPRGIQTMVFRTEKPNEFIEIYSADRKIYSVFKSQRNKNAQHWTCKAKHNSQTSELDTDETNKNTQRASDVTLRTMRLAQSCTGEYAAFFGASTAGTAADKALVLAGFNATLTRGNGVYERELGLHLNLVPQTLNVIYCNPATDPYSGVGGMDNWNFELMEVLRLNANVGNANFDIGHLFGGSGGGGDAGCIGCVCDNTTTWNTDYGYPYPDSYKGSAYTSPSNGIPQGDSFDIDYVTHEVGHQLGGNHTFTYADHGSGYEVGSGHTIMAYAGITNVDVSTSSIEYYHAASIQEIMTNLAGKACIVTTNISARNATPTTTITGANLTVPFLTPFALDCTGNDANAANVLTYSWEQMNKPTTYNNNYSNATANKASGPNFLSWTPTISTTRYFPKMTTVMSNLTITDAISNDAQMNTEALLNRARVLNFRVTVRDNAPYNGTAGLQTVAQTNTANMTVTTADAGAPFSVTSQVTSGISYVGGSTQTITWARGTTESAPFNVANVDILITYDNGLTWTALLSGTPNDGTQSVTMPNPATTQNNCKIMVRSAVTASQKSFFFDVNNVAFQITHVLNENSFEIVDLQLYPNPNNGSFNIKYIPLTDNVKINVFDISGRQIFEKAYLPNGDFNEVINLQNASKGVYLVYILDGDKQIVKKIVVE